MGHVVLFSQHHADTSVGARGVIVDSASNVIFSQPFSEASRTTSAQRRGGIPRARQVLTVEAGSPSSRDTAPVPPRASIASSAVRSIGGNIVRSLRTCQAFATRETTGGPENGEILPMPDTIKEIAQRLIATREAVGFPNQVEFCREIGIEKNIYNPFEKGRRRITVDAAIKIRKRFGIPLDWIYCGDAQALPGQIYRKLGMRAA